MRGGHSSLPMLPSLPLVTCHMKAHRSKFLSKNAAATAYIQRRRAAIVELKHVIEESSEVPNTSRIDGRLEQVQTLVFIPPGAALLVVQSVVNLLVDLVRSGSHLLLLRFGRTLSCFCSQANSYEEQVCFPHDPFGEILPAGRVICQLAKHRYYTLSPQSFQSLGGLSATLPLLDYGRATRNLSGISMTEAWSLFPLQLRFCLAGPLPEHARSDLSRLARQDDSGTVPSGSSG
jgi:hypothetical protein